MPEQNEPKLVPYVDNPLLHVSDHDLSRRIDRVAFVGLVQIGGRVLELEAVYEAGAGGVVAIWQTAPAIAGSPWMIDVIYGDGHARRLFNPKWIDYTPEKSTEIKIKISDEKPG